ncbi:MAG TPA: nodulation protein NfeD [Novosphingobium sp.]|nr:nodulation protein NfeD [Novosphingobium sp.]
MKQGYAAVVKMARLALCLFLACAPFPLSSDAAPEPGRHAVVLKIDGAIGPASAAYLEDGFAQAREGGADLVILEMDTPGGLDTSMREIIREILAMPVPVVAYVHPSGARAASAGTYIVYASHVAAMTPGTNLGAATPIQIGTPGQAEPGGNDKKDLSAAERKAVNDAVAYIRSLAELRGRNVQWAEQAVREGASLSAQAALQARVIDLIAPNMATLLHQLDGREVTIKGQQRRIVTAGMAVREIRPSFTNRLLATITDPNIALILMMVGIYGLLFEFMSPGAVAPGTIGAISLLVGLYALSVLPVDLAGVALILLGMALIVAEHFAPSFGALGIGGIASLVLGATMLMDTDVPGFQISWSVIAAIALAGVGLVALAARLGLGARRMQVATGQEAVIGARGRVLDWRGGTGHVFVLSERWSAAGPQDLTPGALVTIVGIEGLRLTVSGPET